MAKQTINIGAYELDESLGIDSIREAFRKTNENFDDLYGGIVSFSGDYADLTNAPDLSVYALKTELFSKDYADLTNTPTIPADVSDLTDTNNLLDQASQNLEIETVTYGRTNNLSQYIPFVIHDTIQNTLQDVIPPTNVVGGLIVKQIYSKQLSRYTSGGELLLNLICNGGATDYYATKKYVFSRNQSGTFDVTETGTVGSTAIYDSIEVTERLDGTDLYLEITVKAPDSGLDFIRVIGEITYTSVPLFLTASGY
jgi:hypothetical protein